LITNGAICNLGQPHELMIQFFLILITLKIHFMEQLAKIVVLHIMTPSLKIVDLVIPNMLCAYSHLLELNHVFQYGIVNYTHLKRKATS
jgi:hypothetical protein